MEEVDVSTREHVVDGPLSSGSRKALHFVERPEITAALNLPSSLPPPSLFVLFLSIVLCVFFSLPLSSLFLSPSPPSLFLSLSLPHSSCSPSFVLSRSFEQRASRSRVGHAPVRVKVSSVLRRAFLPPRSSNHHLRRPLPFGDHHLPRHLRRHTLPILHHARSPSSSTNDLSRPVPSCRLASAPPCSEAISGFLLFAVRAKRPRPGQTFPIMILCNYYDFYNYNYNY